MEEFKLKREFNYFLKDILDSIRNIKEYTKDMSFEEFQNNRMVFDATTRNFEIIGEAIFNLSSDLKDKYSQVPWRMIKDMRNAVIHQYWKIDAKIEWDIIETELDTLEEQIVVILEKEKNN